MISSSPLFYSDKWVNGTPGWIHTAYDNSSTVNWVNVSKLETHVQIAGLSVIRTLSAIFNPFLSQVYVATAIGGFALVAVIYIERSRVNVFARKAYYDIVSNFGIRELVYIIILTVVFLFLSFAFFMRIGKIELPIRGYPTPVTVRYFGKPFEMFGFTEAGVTSGGDSGEASLQWSQNYAGGMLMLWDGMILNIVLYSVLAFAVVYGAMKVRHHFKSY
jgi:hypothetical protein